MYVSGGLSRAVEANNGCKTFFPARYYSAEPFRQSLVVLFPSVLCTDCTPQAGSRFETL